MVALWWSRPAAAQDADMPRYAEEPTAGLHLPATALAGEPDAFSTVVNPAGLGMLRGLYAGLGLDLADQAQATTAGPGVGLYVANTLGGGLVPRVGYGLGLEVLRPSRLTLSPDLGTPLRLTLAGALPLGPSLSLGASWHRYFDDAGLPLSGVRTWDIGVSSRLGARLALGAVIRDIGVPTIAGSQIERRYELELTGRPLATDRLELALGGRIGEVSANLDAWLRWSARVARGMYLAGEVGTRELRVMDAAGERGERELFASVGLEVSLGQVGAAVFATGTRGDGQSARLAGSSMRLRLSSEAVPSVLGAEQRIERVELAGEIGIRTLTATVLRLRAMARDPGVVAVIVFLDGVSAGWASLEEIRAELVRVRGAGKQVFAYLVSANMREYYLASAASKIYLDPAGGLRLTGFAGTSVYFKGLFDKLGVEAQFEKIEEYKSAPEAWTLEGPTEPAMRMRNELYDRIYTDVVAAIAHSRGLDPVAVRALLDKGPYTAGDLQPGQSSEPLARLVDAVALPEQVSELIVKELGRAYPVAGAPRERPETWKLPAVAVIYIDGDIVDGKSQDIPLIGRKLVGGETIVQAITAARTDPSIQAIVLRIDSPGGSALASELMAREVFKTRGIKPILCSMGDVAASGGYYAAAGCETIFADAMTVTGSIGIFYGKFDISALFGKLGLTWATYKRGERADMESYYRPYTADERTVIKSKMRYLYERFLDTVAQGRSMTREEVDKVGRGRVWAGSRAQEVELVDRIGGLVDAIELAKQRAGLGANERVRVVELPATQTSLVGALLGMPGVKDERPELGWIPGVKALLEGLPGSLLAQPDVPQARLPFTVVWH